MTANYLNAAATRAVTALTTFATAHPSPWANEALNKAQAAATELASTTAAALTDATNQATATQADAHTKADGNKQKAIDKAAQAKQAALNAADAAIVELTNEWDEQRALALKGLYDIADLPWEPRPGADLPEAPFTLDDDILDYAPRFVDTWFASIGTPQAVMVLSQASAGGLPYHLIGSGAMFLRTTDDGGDGGLGPNGTNRTAARTSINRRSDSGMSGGFFNVRDEAGEARGAEQRLHANTGEEVTGVDGQSGPSPDDLMQPKPDGTFDIQLNGTWEGDQQPAMSGMLPPAVAPPVDDESNPAHPRISLENAQRLSAIYAAALADALNQLMRPGGSLYRGFRDGQVDRVDVAYVLSLLDPHGLPHDPAELEQLLWNIEADLQAVYARLAPLADPEPQVRYDAMVAFGLTHGQMLALERQTRGMSGGGLSFIDNLRYPTFCAQCHDETDPFARRNLGLAQEAVAPVLMALQTVGSAGEIAAGIALFVPSWGASTYLIVDGASSVLGAADTLAQGRWLQEYNDSEWAPLQLDSLDVVGTGYHWLSPTYGGHLRALAATYAGMRAGGVFSQPFGRRYVRVASEFGQWAGEAPLNAKVATFQQQLLEYGRVSFGRGELTLGEIGNISSGLQAEIVITRIGQTRHMRLVGSRGGTFALESGERLILHTHPGQGFWGLQRSAFCTDFGGLPIGSNRAAVVNESGWWSTAIAR